MINKINSKIFYLFFIISFFSNSNIAQANVRNTIINKSNCTTRTAKYRSEFQPKFLGVPSSPKGHWNYCISSNGSKYEVLSFFSEGVKNITTGYVEKIGYLNIENYELKNQWGMLIEVRRVFSEEGFPLFGRLTEYECSKNNTYKDSRCFNRLLGKRINIIPYFLRNYNGFKLIVMSLIIFCFWLWEKKSK